MPAPGHPARDGRGQRDAKVQPAHELTATDAPEHNAPRHRQPRRPLKRNDRGQARATNSSDSCRGAAQFNRSMEPTPEKTAMKIAKTFDCSLGRGYSLSSGR